jgi:CO/xanthine dehydrogenase Mo-binding subunit
VSVEASGKVHLERVWCACDPGRLVHPDGAKNQLEGGIVQSASWTLLESLPLDGARVTAESFDDYPIATFRDAPKIIEVMFTAEQGAPSTGVGEPGAVPIAAAIANAVFAACGARVRTLPLTPHRVKTAMLS